MNNVNVNKSDCIKIIKNFIRDLSFENTSNLVMRNYDNSYIEDNMNVIFKPHEKKFFSLILKYNLNCLLKENKKKLFIFELDYFGFFEILGTNNYDKRTLTQESTKLLFPFVKELVEDITKKGGIVPILLKEPDFTLKKI
tara:strand:- start:577 stop:996 length:420 start_codon:yes stop_codon:yes gene_type:complete